MRRNAAASGFRTVLFIFLGIIGPVSLHAEVLNDSAHSQPWYESISINGFLSSAYSYNFNRPDSMKNEYRVFDGDDNSFKVDAFELVFQRPVIKSGDAGFRVDMVAGSSIPHVARSSGFDIGDFDFHQTFLSYIAPLGNGLRFDIGKFITTMGYEVIEGYDGYNYNYSHSFLFGYAIPYTHTGIKTSYSFNQEISGMVMIVNGWDNSIDSNTSKSICGQVIVNPTTNMNVSVNYMFGPEKANNNSDNRQLFDFVGTYIFNASVTTGINGDYGVEQHSAGNGGDAVWLGAAVYCRVNLFSDFSLSFRAEQFEDRDGLRTKTAQKLRELTLTPEFRQSEHFIIRGDARIDTSDKNVFETEDQWKDTQTTLGINFIYTF